MARLTNVTRDELQADDQHFFDEIVGSRGQRSRPLRSAVAQSQAGGAGGPHRHLRAL